MIKLKDEIIGKVEKLSYGTEAIIRYGDDKFVIFVKNAVVDDVLKVVITSVNKSFAKGEILEIVEPSTNRTKPMCALFNACGSCQFQNQDYDFLIKQKTKVLEDIFKNLIDKNDILPIIKSPEIKEYRHKIQYPARQTKNSKRIMLGYFRENSHEITNIKFCPMQPKIINEIAQKIRDVFPFDCYCEKNNKGLLKNVLFRINQKQDEILLVLILNCKKEFCEKNKFEIFFKELTKDFPEIKGCFLNFNSKKSNVILGDETIKILGNDFIIETLKDKKYKIGPISFFQVNPLGAVEIFEIVKKNIKKNSTILDAYGGVGAIGIYVSDIAKRITLVEENSNAVDMAKENFILNNIQNYEIYKGDAKKHFIDFKNKAKTFDYTILDPPRSGCEKDGLNAIAEVSKNIIYVSCNPITLKRDILFLKGIGYKLKFIQGIDLFPYTYHIECVAILEK